MGFRVLGFEGISIGFKVYMQARNRISRVVGFINELEWGLGLWGLRVLV